MYHTESACWRGGACMLANGQRHTDVGQITILGLHRLPICHELASYYRTGLTGKISFLNADDREVFEDAICGILMSSKNDWMLKNRCPRLQRSLQHAGIETEDDHQRVDRG